MMVNPDIRSRPAYSVAEAARYLNMAPAMLRSWIVGRPYSKGAGAAHFCRLIQPAGSRPSMLSFWNLIEAHVLRSLRTDHGVKRDALCRAIRYVQQSLKIERLLLNSELRKDAGKLLLDRYGQLIDLSASGHVAMRRVFDKTLARVEWDERKFAVRLFPVTATDVIGAARPIAIDARVAFGRPVLAQKGITTGAIVERMDAGESVTDLAQDYDLSTEEIMEAVLYERAA